MKTSFIPYKISRIQELPGTSPTGSHQGYSGPTEALRRAPFNFKSWIRPQSMLLFANVQFFCYACLIHIEIYYFQDIVQSSIYQAELFKIRCRLHAMTHFPNVMSFIDQPLLINVILSSESYIISILASGLYPMVEWGIFIFRFLDFTFKKNAFVAYINECLNAMYIY